MQSESCLGSEHTQETIFGGVKNINNSGVAVRDEGLPSKGWHRVGGRGGGWVRGGGGKCFCQFNSFAPEPPLSFRPTDSPYMRTLCHRHYGIVTLRVRSCARPRTSLLRSDNPLILPLFITPPPSPSSTTSASHVRRTRIDHPRFSVRASTPLCENKACTQVSM